MTLGLVTVLLLLAGLAALAQRRPGHPHRTALRTGWRQLRPLLLRLPLALLAAAFLITLLPEELVVAYLGESSGWRGVLLASLCGGLLPGGPAVSFPLVLVLIDEGAGTAQLIALLTAWSVLAFHRVAAHELPMLGGRYTLARLLASAPLPIVAGALAGALARFTAAGL